MMLLQYSDTIRVSPLKLSRKPGKLIVSNACFSNTPKHMPPDGECHQFGNNEELDCREVA